MIVLLLLPVLGAALGASFDANEQLRGMAIDKRGHVYLGAVNALYQLDKDLNVLNKTITGPVQDNPLCIPPQLGDMYCIHDVKIGTIDNYNQLILIDEGNDNLITCGNVYQGTCEARMLKDISFTIPESEAFDLENFVVSTNPSSTTTAFIADMPAGDRSLYVGSYVSPDDFIPEEDRRAVITNRHLVVKNQPSQSFNFYTNINSGFYIQRSWHKKMLVDVTFITGFSTDTHAYFFFRQTDRINTKKVESRVARICLSDKGNNKPIADSTYTSYIELPFACQYQGKKFTVLSGVERKSVKDFLSTGVSDVVVATFGSGNNSSTAVCSFSFDKIRSEFDDKVTRCSKGQGLKQLLLEKTQQKCSVSKSSCTDICTCNIDVDNYPLEVEKTLLAEAPALLHGQVTALTSNVVKDQLELFLGVEESGKYSIMKIVLESPDRSHFIGDFTQALDSKVLQVEVDNERENIVILNDKSVTTTPISVCAQYQEANCARCLLVKDPHCGWCEMSGSCTEAEQCGTRMWRTSGACTAIELISPSTQSMSKQSPNHQVVIGLNNKYPTSLSLTCAFGKYGTKPASVDSTGQITCNIPVVEPVVEGKHSVDLQILNGSVVLATAESGFTFFNCKSYTTCSQCTREDVGCGWCTYANQCSTACITNGVTKPAQCPAVTYQQTFIPAGYPRPVIVKGVNFPKPFEGNTNTYKCKVSIAGGIETLEAVYKDTNTIVCAESHTFSTDEKTGETEASIEVSWGGEDIEREASPQLSIYRCNILGSDCSSCRSNSAQRNCGWCERSNTCMLKTGGYEVCQGAYSDVCLGLRIDHFSPFSGPLDGGTLVKISGRNLGSSPKDIVSINIANLRCIVQEEGFEVSRTVYCRTTPSPRTMTGLLQVRTKGDSFTFGNHFYYKDYGVSSVEPRCGIAAGGTKLILKGTNLTIGSDVSVNIGGSPCEITGDRHHDQIMCTTTTTSAGEHNVELRLDSGVRVSSSPYVVVANPAPLPVRHNSSILSGGIPLNIDFSTVGCVQQMSLIFSTIDRYTGIGECTKSGPKSYSCITPSLTSLTAEQNYVNVHIKADEHLVQLKPFTVYKDPEIVPMLNTTEEGLMEWPIQGDRELVLEGHNLNHVPGIQVFVDDIAMETKVTTNTYLVFTPPQFKELQRLRRKRVSELRAVRSTAESEYIATVTVRLGAWSHAAGRLHYTKGASGGIPHVAIIIPIVGFIILIVILTYVGMKFQRTQRIHRSHVKTMRLQVEKLEMRVANECKEAFTTLQTELNANIDIDQVPYRHFSNFICEVLFPGVENKELLARLHSPRTKVATTPQIANFLKLLQDIDFLHAFVEVVETDPGFGVQDKCMMASLLVISLSHNMAYVTEVLFKLMERLIDRFLAKKNHPQLLLRRTESVADKLLTHWLNYCCFEYLTKHAGKSIFTLYSAIKQHLDQGPQDAITFEAKSSLNNEKMLRETIDFTTLHGTVRDFDKSEHSVTVLTCDSIGQVKRKILEAVHRNKPASQIPSLESFDLIWLNGTSPVSLREDTNKEVVDGWRRVSVLSDYNITDEAPYFTMVPLRQDSETSSSPITERRKTSFLSKKCRSNKSLISAGVSNNHLEEKEENFQSWHLVKPNNDVLETDTLLTGKMISEIYLTRLLSTKGTLQPYVDDLFKSVFMTRDKIPPCIKYLFDFLEAQNKRHNVHHNHPNAIHTWKNNSLSLRFWMNILKNPHFLLDIAQTHTIDSSLNIICGVFMDACSTSDKGLNKDSPINKLLYAKEIPKYKSQVLQHYEQVSQLPPVTLNFDNMPSTGLNTNVALSELLNIASKYQKQLQIALTNIPSLSIKFASTVNPSILTPSVQIV